MMHVFFSGSARHIDTCIDVRVNVQMGMCKGMEMCPGKHAHMRLDKGMGMCKDMSTCVGMCVDTRVDMCADTEHEDLKRRQSYGHVNKKHAQHEHKKYVKACA